MHKVGIAFKILKENEKLPVGFRKVTGYLAFNIKMDFTCKARQVLDSCKTPLPKGSIYARVVLRESIRIAFTYATLNGVNMFIANIRNAYLQVIISEKYYIV